MEKVYIQKKIICLMLVCIMGMSMVGCGKEEVEVPIESSEMRGDVIIHAPTEKDDSVDKWQGEVEVTSKPTETVESSTGVDSETTASEKPMSGAERKDELVSTYAYIDLLSVDTDIAFEDYHWFVLPSDAIEYDYSTYQQVVCAIDIYYNGNVPDTYTCNVATDVISSETNMVFKLRVHGNNGNLLVGLNGYEYTASVEVEEPTETVEPSSEVQVLSPEEIAALEAKYHDTRWNAEKGELEYNGTRESFADSGMTEYETFVIADLDYQSEELKATFPDWLRENMIFYPDETEEVICYAIAYEMSDGAVSSYEDSDRSSYYHYNGSDFVMTRKVNGVDTCFVFCEDRTVVHVYALEDEVITWRW